MANEVRYKDVLWADGTPVEDEMLAANGYYIGQQKGTPLQDEADVVDANDDPYFSEHKTVRQGTALQDEEDDTLVRIAVLVQNLTKCTSDTEDETVEMDEDLTITYTAADGYELPATVEVKCNGVALDGTSDYTWTVGTGVLAIEKEAIKGNLEVTVVATEE